MQDWRGQPIRIGSHVVYPSRQSSNMWVTEGEVIAMDESKQSLEVRKLRSSLAHQKDAVSNRIARPAADRVTVITT